MQQSTKQKKSSEASSQAKPASEVSGDSRNSSPKSTASQTELFVDTEVAEVAQVERQKSDSPRSMQTEDESGLSTITEEKSPRPSDISPRASLDENSSRVLHLATPAPTCTANSATVQTVIPLPPQPTMFQKVKNLLTTIRTNISNAATWIKAKAIQAWGHVKSGFTWVGQGLASIAKSIANGFVRAGTMLWNAVKSVGSFLVLGFTMISSGVASVATKIGSKFKSAVESVKAKMAKPAAPQEIVIETTATSKVAPAPQHENVEDEQILMPKQTQASVTQLHMYENSQQQDLETNDAVTVSEENSNASPKSRLTA